MTIRTPTEMRAAREALGLSRDELAQLCGIAAHELKRREQTKGVVMPGHVIQQLNRLSGIQMFLANALGSNIAIVTYWNDPQFDAHALDVDRLAPTASFHRAAAARASRWSKGVVVCYEHSLFQASEFAVPDTMENRRAWAFEWARNYTVAE
jgi:hypothetical protein